MTDRKALVASARDVRDDEVRARVHEALDALAAEGATISFYAVAERAQVARSTLYRNEGLRAEVAAAREQALWRAQALSPAAEADALRVARAQVSALERQLACVRAERDRFARELAARDERHAGVVFCLVEDENVLPPVPERVSYHVTTFDQVA